MQTRIAACSGDATNSFANTTANRSVSQCLSRPVARRRGVSARKPSAFKYKQDARSEREVTPAAYELAERKFSQVHRLNSSARRALFYSVQCLVHYSKEHGARLGLRRFASQHTGKAIQREIIECGLATCVDPDSWKPKGGDVRLAKARGYIPSFDLLWANIGSQVISSLTEYDNEIPSTRAPLHTKNILFLPCEASGIEIPANVIAAFQSGTGLYCDKARLHRLITSLPAEKWTPKLGATLAAVGYSLGSEIKPVWEQNCFGRVHSCLPAAINMPTALLGSLQSTDGLPLWCVDFSNFELRIACKECGQKTPQGDCYGILGSHCGLDRAAVKTIVNPLLHGQTWQQIRHCRDVTPNLLRNRQLVEEAIKVVLPRLYAGLTRLQRNSAILQRAGASVFFPCMAAAMVRCGIQRVGLPKHDGWVFTATEDQSLAVKTTMEAKAARLTGEDFPAKLEEIAKVH